MTSPDISIEDVHLQLDKSGRYMEGKVQEPEQVALLPDTLFHWEYLLPLWVKKITRPAGLKEIVEVLNISGAQKVFCTVAYHTSPFRLNPSIEGEAVLWNLSKWGKAASASFAGTLIDGILSFRIF